MSRLSIVISAVCVSLLSAMFANPAAAQDEGDWKRGRIYYRMTCTACHKDTVGHSVSPASKTIAEWKTFLDSEKGGAHVRKYSSQEYRKSIAGENRVAEKFAPIPDEEMLSDVRAFVIHGAKDSDTPARCN